MRFRFGAIAVGAAMTMGIAVSAVSAAPAGASTVVRSGESIQAAIDAASPGSTIVVFGAHAENLDIGKDGIKLIGVGRDPHSAVDADTHPVRGSRPS